MTTLAPPFMPAKRIADARKVAREGEWFRGCPEGRCRDGQRCCGSLRRFHENGPRCYPTCLKLALTALLARHAGDDAPDDARDEAFQDILAHDEAYWATIEGREVAEPSRSAVLFFFLTALAEEVEGAAA